MRPERSKPVAIRGIGPDLVCARLWKESGILEELRSVLKARQYEFDVERAILCFYKSLFTRDLHFEVSRPVKR